MTTRKQEGEKLRRERNKKVRAAIFEEKVLREIAVQGMYRVRQSRCDTPTIPLLSSTSGCFNGDTMTKGRKNSIQRGEGFR